MSGTTASEKHTIDYNAKVKLIFLVTEKEKKDLTEEKVNTLLWDGSPFDSKDEDDTKIFQAKKPWRNFSRNTKKRSATET